MTVRLANDERDVLYQWLVEHLPEYKATKLNYEQLAKYARKATNLPQVTKAHVYGLIRKAEAGEPEVHALTTTIRRMGGMWKAVRGNGRVRSPRAAPKRRRAAPRPAQTNPSLAVEATLRRHGRLLAILAEWLPQGVWATLDPVDQQLVASFRRPDDRPNSQP